MFFFSLCKAQIREEFGFHFHLSMTQVPFQSYNLSKVIIKITCASIVLANIVNVLSLTVHSVKISSFCGSTWLHVNIKVFCKYEQAL